MIKWSNISDYSKALGQFVAIGLLFILASPFLLPVLFWAVIQDMVKANKKDSNVRNS